MIDIRPTLIDAVTAVRRRVPTVDADSPDFECAYCNYSYDGERHYCLACGGPVREGGVRRAR